MPNISINVLYVWQGECFTAMKCGTTMTRHIYRPCKASSLCASGVILLRLAKRSPQDEVEAVAQAIQKHGAALLNAFTVIKPQGNARIRRKP